jgi:hypothetical protein
VKHHTGRRFRLRTRRTYALLTAMAIIGIGSLVFLASTRAASVAASAQLALGQLRGNISVVAEPTAYRGTAVRFGQAGSCVVEPASELRDQYPVPAGQIRLPTWPHQLSRDITVYFSTAGLTTEYRGYVAEALNEWNQRDCIDARLVTTCPANVNCVDMSNTTTPVNGRGGLFIPYLNQDMTYMVYARIELYTNTLAGISLYERQGVVTHEIGHALSLDHRNTNLRLMYPIFSRTSSQASDTTDQWNLYVKHGQESIRAFSGSSALPLTEPDDSLPRRELPPIVD